jgi:hypothetical protein
VRVLQGETSWKLRARYALVIAGTLVGALLGCCSVCCADFSSAHFKRVWFDEFGPGLLPHAQPPLASSQFSAPAIAFQSQQPHPAVARIVVPEGEATSFGSGTLIDVRDGFGIVVTNWHVVRDAQGPIEVIFPNGFTSKARALKTDADWDLAALVVWRPPVEPVKIAAAAPQPGDQLTICGYGPGVYRAATGRCTQYYAPKENLPQQMVELNVEARQGDSGGPILNSRGELAGVLFGAGDGTTLGSFGGRVDEFLASLAPDIGSQRALQMAEGQKPVEQAVEPSSQSKAESWRSSIPRAMDPEVKTASTTLLKPPSFEELEQAEVERATPLNSLAATGQMPASTPLGQSLPFEKIKTGLAAFGVFSIAVMLLKAAR